MSVFKRSKILLYSSKTQIEGNKGMELNTRHIYLLLAARRHVTLFKYFKLTSELISFACLTMLCLK